ncbi:hypothetical protein V474_24435 [Novosphingobium barchaimii LL02]|uniref:PilZ domain-containing protein n=1 Tax=Novosphingobium barchaimii LL02 TaxID=1114963 RepID=A0A0J7XM13_9SPHN|nr:hypothetical protein V474_24435 [Novosphingobium barchaimii LL02]
MQAARYPALRPSADQSCGRLFPREDVEMMARFRRDIASSTVMLKDLTPFGARVEGVGALEIDEMVTISLPGCRPSLAFVAWANAHGAGLEFIEPLSADRFDDLVARYGLSGGKEDSAAA